MHCILKNYVETQKLRFRFTLSSFFMFFLPSVCFCCGIWMTPHTTVFQHAPSYSSSSSASTQSPSFLHQEYNARIRGLSNSMSFRSEHHRSYSFSGLSPLTILHFSLCPPLPSVLFLHLCHLILHSAWFFFYLELLKGQ